MTPDFAKHKGYRREADKLVPIPDLFGWISPRLGIQFEMTPQMKEVLRILTPQGRPIESYTGIARKLDLSERRIEEEHERANEERQRANEATLRAEQERQRVERLLAQLRASGLEPEA